MKLLVKDAAKYLNISKEAIYNRIRRGTLKSIKEDNKTYVLIEPEQNSLAIKDELLEQIKILKLSNEELKKENEELKNKINLPVIIKAKWILIDEYLLRFKKKKREKIKKYLISRLFKSKKIKLENNQVFIRNKKLSKI
ncbi:MULTISPECIES: helix-turn-helix domain-containing protein [unclassified Campylobacter]|uniref:helix-turn-helix domain-containing protein n=1 Tax=unclassified Campylobacter TaxID=2593542 RepID=UPI001BDA8F03|nr:MULTISPECIES: helix-turn-helix domain-containing protein [unclassified Campylobacter]MBZ7976669.1 helix-turn-helix domain-containing protein [Campylobacter sp. RM12637]MBZ7978323.1 helix-turn-helix domain-containing protein [Campylobacter sp. RM12654]MBZ7979325.1 helix-turn-helix domain-containing protein [Campylobacter sp. RM12642]MBZ7981332.1 helix-turn-helix domain-containing protein [Campylobacter sp. RM12640]MBZ7984017.1 helix-turn-helix domain-containing protein [Campylobacter sp. RM1